MQRAFTNWSIRRRLVYLVVTIALLTFVAVALIALNASSATLRRETERAFVGQNQALANALDRHLQDVVSTTRAFAAALADQPAAPLTQLWQMASNVLLDETHVVQRVNVYALSETGHETVIFNAPPRPLRVAFVQQLIDNVLPGSTWFLQTLRDGQERWHGPDQTIDINSRQQVISYAVPYRGIGAEWVGVVWVDISLRQLETVLGAAAVNNRRESYSLLITPDNQVAAAYNLPVKIPRENRSVVLSAFLSQPELMLTRSSLNELDGLFVTAPDPFVSGQSSAILINPLPGRGWQLITLLPANFLQSPLDRSILQMLLVAIGGIGLMAWVIYTFVGRTVSAPLRTLSAAAQGIGSGDMRFQVGYQNQLDEIGLLATALEDMKRNIAYSYRQLSMWSQTLEKRVEQRTAELEIARKVALAHATELEAVYDASLSVVSDYQLEIVLQKLTENILSLLRASYCAVWLLTSDKEHLQLVATTSPNRNRLNSTISVDEGLVGAAVREGQLMIVDDYINWPGRLDKLSTARLERAMAAPLTFYKKPIGSVLVGRLHKDTTFSEADQRLLTLFANLVSPIVRNAQLFIQREVATKDAERASSVKTRFLASVTHELRTPLNLIINNMDFMRIGTFGAVNDEQRSRLDQTVRSAEHLLALINDLLDVSKIEASEMELTIRMADLHPVLEDSIDSAVMMLDAKKSSVALEPYIPDHLPLIPMDARRVRQILTNLLSNAVKFTSEGAIILHVRLLEDAVEISVRDSGMGMSAEEIERLFQPFERSERAKHQGIEGTGLGLAITRFLVEAHGGVLTLESAVGKGSIFTFTLPRETPPREATSTMRALMGLNED